MKKQRLLLDRIFSLLTLLGIFSLGLAFFYFSNGLNIKNLVSNTPIAKHKSNPRNLPSSQFNGWIAWWDEENTINSLKKSSKFLTSISPVWYRIDKEGKLQKIPHKQEALIKNIARQSNISTIPTITNEFDSARVLAVVNNSDIAQKLSEELANLATESNYRGFDIDWEEIDPKYQNSFSIFIQKLADFLHTYNLVLTVSVHPQTGESDREVAKGYNLAGLSKGADSIKVMAYDIHNQNSSPGAIIPFAYLAKILDYTSSIVPPEKLILGVPSYGYDWEIGGKNPAEAVSFLQADERIKKYNGNITRDPESNSLVGNYNLDGKKHTIWFEDNQTLSKIIDKARSFGVYQFSFWRIGAEDSKIWDSFSPKLQPSSAPTE